MNYLLDTCVLSELIKPIPNQNVIDWISGINERCLFISVLTIGEIHKGIAKLPESRKKEDLHRWVKSELKERFNNKILNIDVRVATTWGKVQATSEHAGQPLPSIDGLIACTAIVHDLTVATRNTKDMKASGVALINPWEGISSPTDTTYRIEKAE